MDCQGAQSQKEGQEEGTKDLGRGTPLAVSPFPGPPGLPSGSGLPGNPPGEILCRRYCYIYDSYIHYFGQLMSSTATPTREMLPFAN